MSHFLKCLPNSNPVNLKKRFCFEGFQIDVAKDLPELGALEEGGKNAEGFMKSKEIGDILKGSEIDKKKSVLALIDNKQTEAIKKIGEKANVARAAALLPPHEKKIFDTKATPTPTEAQKGAYLAVAMPPDLQSSLDAALTAKTTEADKKAYLDARQAKELAIFNQASALGDRIYKAANALKDQVNAIFDLRKKTEQMLQDVDVEDLDGLIDKTDKVDFENRLKAATTLEEKEKLVNRYTRSKIKVGEKEVELEQGDIHTLTLGIISGMKDDEAKQFVDGLPKGQANIEITDIQLRILGSIGFYVGEGSKTKDRKAAIKSDAGKLIAEIAGDQDVNPGVRAEFLKNLAQLNLNLTGKNALEFDTAVEDACAKVKAEYTLLKQAQMSGNIPLDLLGKIGFLKGSTSYVDPAKELARAATFFRALEEAKEMKPFEDLDAAVKKLVTEDKTKNNSIVKNLAARVAALRVHTDKIKTELPELQKLLTQVNGAPVAPPARASVPASAPAEALAAPSVVSAPLGSGASRTEVSAAAAPASTRTEGGREAAPEAPLIAEKVQGRGHNEPPEAYKDYKKPVKGSDLAKKPSWLKDKTEELLVKADENLGWWSIKKGEETYIVRIKIPKVRGVAKLEDKKALVFEKGEA